MEQLKKKEFIEEIIKLYKKYGLSLAHEDTQGAFIILEYTEENEQWLRDSLSIKNSSYS